MLNKQINKQGNIFHLVMNSTRKQAAGREVEEKGGRRERDSFRNGKSALKRSYVET